LQQYGYVFAFSQTPAVSVATYGLVVASSQLTSNSSTTINAQWNGGSSYKYQQVLMSCQPILWVQYLRNRVTSFAITQGSNYTA